jgi:hypothetical protein
MLSGRGIAPSKGAIRLENHARADDYPTLPRSKSRGAAKKCSQVDRPISTGGLNTLLHLHLQPIYLVFYQEPDGESSS